VPASVGDLCQVLDHLDAMIDEHGQHYFVTSRSVMESYFGLMRPHDEASAFILLWWLLKLRHTHGDLTSARYGRMVRGLLKSRRT
jgi:hypothetical protein